MKNRTKGGYIYHYGDDMKITGITHISTGAKYLYSQRADGIYVCGLVKPKRSDTIFRQGDIPDPITLDFDSAGEPIPYGPNDR